MTQTRANPRTITSGLRAKAWWVLRKNKAMTVAEIMLTICDGSEKYAGTNISSWLNKLAKAGVFSREATPLAGREANGRYRYVLVRDLGPKPPVWRRDVKQVFDPNSGEILGGSDE
ncbi:MAG: hypothetical protein BVN35_09435 [Proteobacteria bacterium ST_bin11]|nr:MAG: hypothetical protein BVN35_09435 [Proteobacteria bacterium ST_bin11]